MVSEAECVPDQVGDVLRAKHAGSCVVLPTGSAALCHLPSRLVCVLWRVGKGCERIGGSRNPSWCQINTGSGAACPGYETDCKALGGIRKRERRNSRTWERLGRELSFSFVLPLLLPFPSSSNLVGKPSLFTNPLDTAVLKQQEAVRAGSLFLSYCQRDHWCPFNQLHRFPDKITYKVTNNIETWRHSLMDNMINHIQLDEGGGFWEEKKGQRQLSEDSSKYMFACSKI